jgi:ATP-dependent DNA helicase 2 subunit 2
MIAKPPTASTFVEKMDMAPSGQSSATMALDDPSNGTLSAVRNQRSYQVDDPDEPGVKKSVEVDELERGYEYGRTAVHISEAESNIVNLETTQGLELIGFVQEEKASNLIPMYAVS